jgi:hypothetical protein
MITPDDITIADFKSQFYRGFDYLPIYSNSIIYNAGNLVFYETDQLFYTCKTNGIIGQIPTNATYWTLTEANKYDFVWDEDIEEAFAEAKLYYRTANNMSDSGIRITFLYLAAHFLVTDLRANGVNSQFNAPVSSRSVGNVSEAYSIPDWMKSASLSFFTSTYYGYKYLTLTRPYRIANVFIVPTPRHAMDSTASIVVNSSLIP